MFTALGFSTTQSYQLILFWRIPFLRIYGWSIVDVDRNDNVVDSSFTLALQSLMFQILDAFCVLVSPVFYDHYLIWIACLFIEGLLLIPILLMYILGLFLLQVMINTLDRYVDLVVCNRLFRRIAGSDRFCFGSSFISYVGSVYVKLRNVDSTCYFVSHVSVSFVSTR